MDKEFIKREATEQENWQWIQRVILHYCRKYKECCSKVEAEWFADEKIS